MVKTKIIFIINNFLVGGVERLLFDIISSLDKEKYDIQIVTVLGSGPLETSFKQLGIPIYFAGTSNSFSRKFFFKFFWILTALITFIRITFFLSKSKPDIVITSLYQADVLGITAAKIVGVKKRILIQHDIVRFGRFIRFVKKNFALKFSTQIVSVSATVKDFLVEYFEVNGEKITTIFNGIDYELFKKGRRLSPNFSAPVIGVIGRLEEIKGHIYLLKALKILREKHNLFPVTFLAGEGKLRKDLEKYVVTNNLNSIKFLGSVENIPEFLSPIDILVIPSLEEGFGLVVLEGMVSGKVVIASDIKVMHELITDGDNGLLFKSEDTDSLAKVLFNVLTNKEICEKLQNNALLFIEQNKKLFDIHNVLKTYENLLFSK